MHQNSNLQLHPLARGSLALLFCVGANAQLFASPQTAPLSGNTTETAPQAPKPAASMDLGGYRLALLREGASLVHAVGEITQDPDERNWVFRARVGTLNSSGPGASASMRRELLLMPSPVLEDMLRVQQLSPVPVEFEVTGKVFIYRGRNWLLPELAPPIMRFDAAPSAVVAPQAAPTAATQSPNGKSSIVLSDDPDDAAVRELERRLEARIGTVPGVARREDPRRIEEDAVVEAMDDAANSRASDDARLHARRGQLTRDPTTGAWRFLPQQGRSKHDDLALELLPCLMLERLERSARETDGIYEIIVSGSVLLFEGRRFLLPSWYQRAREV
ncbi:MAG: hypothetical protein EXS10_04070 [Phycisphaerales bacterium]|nr:hypothetical protein [Phycisphaerales bacterium]